VFAMIETAQGLSDLEDICAVHGLTGVYVGAADLSISMGYDVTEAWTNPAVWDEMAKVAAAANAAGLIAGIHASDGQNGNAAAQTGFRLITLASESQALRRGAAAHLKEATAQ
jgi:4-hydroxy-2-oxoheptanedioate aldolase